MANPIEHVRQKLVDRIAGIVDSHHPTSGGVVCSCGSGDSPDYSHHVAGEIVRQLGLAPDSVDDVKKRIRYASAVLDWELTKLEGAEC
jgi:hypothetical protein